MRNLAPFLPPHLVAAIARDGGPELPSAAAFDAALLFSDISGFTALTERLQTRGREGAEEVTGVVSAAFQPAIEAIEQCQGSIVSFGGDALFAVFPGACAVGRACAAAAAIRACFAARPRVRTSAGEVSLGISQAIHYGRITGVHLGKDRTRHYLLLGAAVSRLARLEEKVKAGEVIVSQGARAARRVEPPWRRRPRKAVRPAAAAIQPYLPEGLAPLLGRFEGCYRQAAVLFLETRGRSVSALQHFFLLLESVLGTYDGVLLKSDLSAQGVKWLCVFGIPAAHEDDVDRAARAAIAVRDRAPRALGLRGGLHAGTLVNIEVGTRTRRSFDVMGDVVNTAARALGRAAWGEVLATEHLCRELRGIETAGRGAHEVKGKAEALHLRALGKAGSTSRAVRAAAPLVGRDAELRELRAMLDAAASGHGAVVGISAEAGLGKSRLRWEVARLAESASFRVHQGRPAPYGGRPYGAVAELLRQALEIPDGLPSSALWLRVFAAAEDLGLSVTDRHHLADVLGVRDARSPLLHLDGRAIRLNNTIAIRACLMALARRAPRLYILEDMHLSDELSREAVEFVTREVRGAAAVVLMVYRPGYDLPASGREIKLAEISPEAVSAMLAALLGAVPPEVDELVRERAEGNPFYVEEVVRHLVEAGFLARERDAYRMRRSVGPQDLPGTIESVIAARLDRLPSEPRRVAEVGSVVGRVFALPVLLRLDEVKGHARASVKELESRDIVAPKSSREPFAEYAFKSAVTRDVAYGAILVSRRKVLHRAVAASMEALYREEIDAYRPALGHHWEQAGEEARARGHYLEAARRSAARYAHEEAERLYRSYLRLVEAPDAESIAARTDLAEDVLKVCGRNADAIVELERARDEASSSADVAQQAVVARALGGLYRITGRVDDAMAAHERALDLCRKARDRREEGVCLSGLANVHRDCARLDEARALLRLAISLHRQAGDRASEGASLGHLASVLQMQGRSGEARAAYEQSVAVHREVGDRRNEGITLGNLATLHGLEGAPDRATTLLEQSLAISRESGDRRAMGITLANLAMMAQQQLRPERARDLYRQALQIHREVGNRRSEAITLANLGTCSLDLSQNDEARAYNEAAIAISRELHERRVEAAALMNQANILTKGGDTDESIRLLARCAEMSRELKDRPLEAIVVSNIGSLELDVGRIPEAVAALEQSLQIAREVGNRSIASFCLTQLAMAARAALNEPARAGKLLGEAEAELRDCSDSASLARWAIEKARLELACGRSPTTLIALAEGHVQDARSATDLTADIEAVRLAAESVARGEKLYRGELWSHVNKGIRRWLEEKGEVVPR